MKAFGKRRGIPLDSSGIVHLAVLRKGYTNTFRLSAAMDEPVCPKALQAAVDKVSPHFPTIVAGIRPGLFHYMVVPADKPPAVHPDNAPLADMPQEMIRNCAVRILYGETQIAVEIFHSLTDGYGGMEFFKALLMEYLCQKGCIIRSTEQTFTLLDSTQPKLQADDYLTYAGAETAPMNRRKVYRLPGQAGPEHEVELVAELYDTQELVETARYFGVSLTVLLTAIMTEAVFSVQRSEGHGAMQPVQIMVPINLRKRFPSRSLRNFSLYALPCIMPDQEALPFEKLLQEIADQLRQQCSKEYLSAQLGSVVKLQNLPIVRFLPLALKNFFLRIGFHFCGERNSCLSVSNLGAVEWPQELQRHIQHLEFSLTPRRNAPYNFGVVSFNGKLAICFSRRSDDPSLEQRFFKGLSDMGYEPEPKAEMACG